MPDRVVEPLITRSYLEADLPTYEHIHATITPTTVSTDQLHPTQSKLMLARLLAIHHGQPAEGPDPHPHVVTHNGRLWVHNGHHRWVTALLHGDPTITVRVASLPARPCWCQPSGSGHYHHHHG